jgi:hypothetical protein
MNLPIKRLPLFDSFNLKRVISLFANLVEVTAYPIGFISKKLANLSRASLQIISLQILSVHQSSKNRILTHLATTSKPFNLFLNIILRKHS